jgi:pyridoxal phosphate enzyme (YggS family)
MSTLCDRLTDVRARIRYAAQGAGRDPDSIRLIAVSKTHPVGSVMAAYACGQVDFGENRVQELVPKMEQGPAVARWHMIGTLQTNKIKYLAQRVDVIHSVPSLKALQEIDKRAGAAGRVIEVLIQVNISDEDHKSGCEPGDLPELVEAANAMAHIRLTGLMGIASLEADAETVRPQFRMLRELRDRHLGPEAGLSMGMSHDLEVAVQEGATMVRVGTSIFGERTVS